MGGRAPAEGPTPSQTTVKPRATETEQPNGAVPHPGVPLVWLTPVSSPMFQPRVAGKLGEQGAPSLDNQTVGLLWRSGFSSPSAILTENFLFFSLSSHLPPISCTLVDEDEDKQRQGATGTKRRAGTSPKECEVRRESGNGEKRMLTASLPTVGTLPSRCV